MKPLKFKRTLLVLALMATIMTAMTGGTIAWFTDTVQSTNNIIKSGNLDVEMYWADGKENPETAAWKNASEGTIFNYDLWEPGYVEIRHVKIENVGNLALKYDLKINPTGPVSELADVIDVYYVDPAQQVTSRGELTESLKIGTLTKILENNGSLENTAAGELKADEEHIVTIALKMQESAGNEYMGKAIGTDFAITLLANQLEHESDSFDNEYDADASAIIVDIFNFNDFDKLEAGNVANLCNDITLSEAVTLPANVEIRGNGYQVNGTINASGDLTISGHLKVTAFNAGYYDRTITIGEGSCLEITGSGRMTLGYGNVFNITGNLENAKTAQKANVKPSLIIPGGISITGGNDATMNVKNAYVKIGNTTSKNSAANGIFTLNFTNSIAEFTNQFTLSEPTNGMKPTFNINIKDSVLTTATKFIAAAPSSNVVINNSTVTLTTYFRNSGNMLLENGSELTGNTIQFGENGGNDGTTTIDGSTFTINATSTGHALDGKNTGKLVLKNNATATVDYYKDLTIDIDDTSTITGTKVQ